jgi:hypothetical protein
MSIASTLRERAKIGEIADVNHFILEDEIPQPAHASEPTSLTRRVLQHALASV